MSVCQRNRIWACACLCPQLGIKMYNMHMLMCTWERERDYVWIHLCVYGLWKQSDFLLFKKYVHIWMHEWSLSFKHHYSVKLTERFHWEMWDFSVFSLIICLTQIGGEEIIVCPNNKQKIKYLNMRKDYWSTWLIERFLSHCVPLIWSGGRGGSSDFELIKKSCEALTYSKSRSGSSS